MFNKDLHLAVMSNILQEIFSNRSLGENLGFKGGTAAMLFYKLDRFSVDLDFNLLNGKKKSFIYKEMQKIISKYGKIEDLEDKKNTLFFLLSYGKEERKLKLEISKRETKNEYDFLSYFGVDIRVMKKEFMFAHKLVAIMERKDPASRDLYDINYFLKENWDLEESIIQERTGISLDKYLTNLVNYIEKTFNSRNTLQGLGELLTTSQKDYARMKLKNDVLFRLKLLKSLTT